MVYPWSSCIYSLILQFLWANWNFCLFVKVKDENLFSKLFWKFDFPVNYHGSYSYPSLGTVSRKHRFSLRNSFISELNKPDHHGPSPFFSSVFCLCLFCLGMAKTISFWNKLVPKQIFSKLSYTSEFLSSPNSSGIKISLEQLLLCCLWNQ